MITNIEFEDINHSDYPDYTDVFISSADIGGVPMNETQLNELNEDRDFVYESLMEGIF